MGNGSRNDNTKSIVTLRGTHQTANDNKGKLILGVNQCMPFALNNSNNQTAKEKSNVKLSGFISEKYLQHTLARMIQGPYTSMN